MKLFKVSATIDDDWSVFTRTKLILADSAERAYEIFKEDCRKWDSHALIFSETKEIQERELVEGILEI